VAGAWVGAAIRESGEGGVGRGERGAREDRGGVGESALRVPHPEGGGGEGGARVTERARTRSSSVVNVTVRLVDSRNSTSSVETEIQHWRSDWRNDYPGLEPSAVLVPSVRVSESGEWLAPREWDPSPAPPSWLLELDDRLAGLWERANWLTATGAPADQVAATHDGEDVLQGVDGALQRVFECVRGGDGAELHEHDVAHANGVDVGLEQQALLFHMRADEDEGAVA